MCPTGSFLFLWSQFLSSPFAFQLKGLHISQPCSFPDGHAKWPWVFHTCLALSHSLQTPEWIPGNGVMERTRTQSRVKTLTLSFPSYITWHKSPKILKPQSLPEKFRKMIPHLPWESSGITYMKVVSKTESHTQMEAVWQVLFSVISWLHNAGQWICQY